MNVRARAVSPEELLAHADWLRKLAACLVRDPERADDVAQETWRRALEKPPRERDNLRGWLTVAARHVAQQIGRSERARANREVLAARVETEPSTADVVEQAALHRDLVARVLELDEPYRTALLLRHFHDCSPRQIAEELGIPLNTVRSQLARGLEQLRERLDAEAGGREFWMHAVAPLAVLAPNSVTRFAWTPTLAGMAATVGAIAAFVHLTRAPQPVETPAELAVAHAVEPMAAGGAASQAVLSRAGAERERLSGSRPPLQVGEGGILELRFVDESGAALADLEFCVFKERGGNLLFHRGYADDRGTATVRNLPENVILVQTARRAPQAMGFAAVWLRQDEQRALEVRVGRGGRIVGRAVDDRGVPVAGLEVALPAGPCAYRSLPKQVWPWPDETAARTDSEGRFIVEAIAELPRSVWIVEGEPRPEMWMPQRVTLKSERFPCSPLATARGVVRTTEELDVGDIVVPRSVTYEGVVLDGERQPIVGALVSLDPHRIGSYASWGNRAEAGQAQPGTPGFELEGVDVLSASDGAFRLEVPWSAHPREFLVWTPGGRRGRPAAPELSPGEVRDGLVLTISSARALALDLRSPEGARVDFTELPADLMLYGRYVMLPALGAGRVLVASTTGELIELKPEPDADGLMRLATELRACDVRAIDLFVAGFLPEHVDLPQGFPAEPLVLDLRAQPRIRVCLQLAGGETPSREAIRVRVGACRMGVESIGVADRWSRCCGFGCLATVSLDDEPIDLDLPVVTDEPYWLTVYATARRRRVPPRVLGPFAPAFDGTERHVVIVDPGELQPYLVSDARVAKEERAPPAPAEPSTGRAADPRDLRDVESEDGSLNRPGFVARLLEADGEPVAEGTNVRIVGAEEVSFRGSKTRVGFNGRVEFSGDAPACFVLAVNPELGGPHGLSASARGFQLFEVDGWSPGSERELRLAARHTVEVVVRGLRDEESALQAHLWVSPPEHAQPMLESPQSVGCSLREVAPAHLRTRRFRLELPPGLWVVRGAAGMLEISPTTIEVRDAEDVQTFEVAVMRP